MLGIVQLSSCQKWLEVQPEDKFTVNQIYATPSGVRELVNGFYIKMGSNALYGERLTLTGLEAMAQRFKITSDKHPYYNYQTLDYGQENMLNSFSTVWIQMYDVISNINDMVKTLPTVENGMTATEKDQLIGEAIALRAFIHFDLLRLFGPRYTEESKLNDAIPYVTKLSIEIMPFSNSEVVIQKILEDIATAKTLMLQDPILTQNGSGSTNNGRFNYYAAVALEARVQQWAGNRPAALAAAQEVIAVQNKFPWVTHQAITSNGANPDRIFSTEIIFSVFNRNLYDVQKNYFDSNLQESSLMATGNSNLVDEVYDHLESDYRLSPSWPIASTGVGYKTFVKYQDLSDSKILSRFLVPVIRISEMYYIAAESTDDQTAALGYINTVLQHRNILLQLTDYAAFENALTKEYMKEFYGEGQLWYYYKRKNKTNIFSVSLHPQSKIMSESSYMIPIPKEEEFGR